jgi:hypothetical protein
MKKGESLQLSYTWWDKGRPPTMKSTGLGAALKDYERAKKQTNHLAALKALTEVDAARRRGIALCTGALFPDTKAALQKDGAIATAATAHTNAIGKNLAKAKVRVDDIKLHMTKLPGRIKEFDKLPPGNQKDAKEKDIRVNYKYLRDAISGAKTTMDGLHAQENALQHYPELWKRYTAVRDQYAKVLQPARDLVKNHTEFAE